ncbi:MAG TPA: CapA family protein [Candidatus Blautia stercoravium]|nr:CapA family protein [Candidatus Blautia stercoravium]
MNEKDKEYEKRLREKECRRQQRRKEVLKQRMILGTVGGLLAVLLVTAGVSGIKKASKAAKEEQKRTEAAQKAEEARKAQDAAFTISAAGDCTLGTDENFDYERGFTGKYDAVQDPSYFFKEVKSIFEADDLTIVNMEGTLTEEETRADKLYAFKADPEYAKILTAGHVETVNLANNHTYDYGEKSYTDTIAALDAEGIISFGNDRTSIIEVQGIKVGLLGTYELRDHMGCEQEMKDNITNLKEQGAQVIIATFHWGEERENIPNETQIALAHSAIDNGADLVLGHHPHVLQGIEEYKGKNIVYSLGNFCFGGNSGPADMDTMIFQQTFTFVDGELQKDNVTNIIPCKISSAYADGYNNYQPIPAEGEEKEAILDRIEQYSQAVETKENTQENSDGDNADFSL